MDTSHHVPCALVLLLLLCGLPHVARGTGSLYDPPSRPVMWKYGYPTPKNYNYMQLNCGGEKQLEDGPKQCGVCGDYVNGTRDHEYGGTYGTGLIGRYYPAESKVKVELLAFEEGFFEFRLCPANNQPVTQACLDEYLLPIKEGFTTGTPFRFLPKAAGDYRLTIAVPPNITCDRCVLQWRYHTGNSWGTDPVTGENGKGFGPQEEFYNCADIRIGGVIPDTVRANPFFSPLEPSPLVSTKTIATNTAAMGGGVNPTSVDMNANKIDILVDPATSERSLVINETITTNNNSGNTEWRITAKGSEDTGFVQSSASAGGKLDQTNMIPPLGSLPALSETAGEASQQSSVSSGTTTDLGSFTIASNTGTQAQENTQHLSTHQLGTSVNVNTRNSAGGSSDVMSNLEMTSAIDPTFKADEKQMASIVINTVSDSSRSMIDQPFTTGQSGHKESGQTGKLIINNDISGSRAMMDESITMGQSEHQNSAQTGKLIINMNTDQPGNMADQSFIIGQSVHENQGQTGKLMINTDINGSRAITDQSTTMSEHQNLEQTGKLIINTDANQSDNRADQSFTMGQSEHMKSGQTSKLKIITDANQSGNMAEQSFMIGESEKQPSGTMGAMDLTNTFDTGATIDSLHAGGAFGVGNRMNKKASIDLTVGQRESTTSSVQGIDSSLFSGGADQAFMSSNDLSTGMDVSLVSDIGSELNTVDQAFVSSDLGTASLQDQAFKSSDIGAAIVQDQAFISSDLGTASLQDQAFITSDVGTKGLQNQTIKSADVAAANVQDQAFVSSDLGTTNLQDQPFITSDLRASGLQDQAFATTDLGTKSLQDQTFVSTDVVATNLQDQVVVSSDVGAANVQDQAFVSSDLGTANLLDRASLSIDLGTQAIQDQAFVPFDLGVNDQQDQAFVSSDMGNTNFQDQGFVQSDVGAATIQDQAFASSNVSATNVQDQPFVSSAFGDSNLQDKAFISPDVGTTSLQDQAFVPSDVGTTSLQDRAFLSSDVGATQLQDQAFVPSDVGTTSLKDQAFVSSNVGSSQLQDQAFVSSNLGVSNIQDQALASSDVGAANVQDQAFVSTNTGTSNSQDQAFVSSDVGTSGLQDQAFVSSDVGTSGLQDQAFVSSDVGTSGLQDQAFVSSDAGTSGLQDQAFVSLDMGTTQFQDQVSVSSDLGTSSLQDQTVVSSDIGTVNLLDQAFVSSDLGTTGLQDQAFVSSDLGTTGLQDQALVSSNLGTSGLQDQAFATSDLGTSSSQDQAFASLDLGTTGPQDQAFVSSGLGTSSSQDKTFASLDLGTTGLQDQAFASLDLGTTGLQDQAFVSSDLGATRSQDQAFVSSADQVATIQMMADGSSFNTESGMAFNDNTFNTIAAAKDKSMTNEDVLNNRNNLPSNDMARMNIPVDNTFNSNSVNNIKKASILIPPLGSNKQVSSSNNLGMQNNALLDSKQKIASAELLKRQEFSVVDGRTTNILNEPSSNQMDAMMITGDIKAKSNRGSQDILASISSDQTGTASLDVGLNQNMLVPDTRSSINIRNEANTVSTSTLADQSIVGLNMRESAQMSTVDVGGRVNTLSSGRQTDQSTAKLNIQTLDIMPSIDVGNSIDMTSTNSQMDQGMGEFNIQTPDIMPNIDAGNSIDMTSTNSRMGPGTGDMNMQATEIMSNTDVLSSQIGPGMGEVNMQAPDIMPNNDVGIASTGSQVDTGIGELNMQPSDTMSNIDVFNSIDTFSTGSQIGSSTEEVNMQAPNIIPNIDVGNSITISSTGSLVDQGMGELNMQAPDRIQNIDTLNTIDTFSTSSQVDPGMGELNKQAPDVMPNIDVSNSIGISLTGSQGDQGMGELNMQAPDIMPNIDVSNSKGISSTGSQIDTSIGDLNMQAPDIMPNIGVGIPTGSLIIGSQRDQNIGELNMQLSESVTNVDVGSTSTNDIQAPLDQQMNNVNTNGVGNVPSTGINELPRGGSRGLPITDMGVSGRESSSTGVTDTGFVSFDSISIPDSTAIGVDSPQMNDQFGSDITLTNELNLAGNLSPIDRPIGGSFIQPTDGNLPAVQGTNIDPFVDSAASLQTSNAIVGQTERVLQSGVNMASDTQRASDRTIMDFNPPPGASIIDSSMTLDTSSGRSMGTVDVGQQIGESRLSENNAPIDITFTNMDAPLSTATTGQMGDVFSVMGGSVKTTMQGAMNADSSMGSQGTWETNSLDFNQEPDFGNSVEPILGKNIARTQSAAAVDMNMATRIGGDLNNIDGSAQVTGQNKAPRQSNVDRKIIVSNTVISNEPNTNSIDLRVVDTTTDRTTFMNDVRATKQRMARKFQAKSILDNRRDSANDVPVNIKNELNSFNINNIPDDSVMETNVQVDASGVLRPRFGQRVDQTTRFRNLNRSFNTTNVGSSGTTSGESSSSDSPSSGGVMRVVIDPRTGAETRIWGAITNGNRRANGQMSTQGDTRNNGGRTSTSRTGRSRVANGDRRERVAFITRGDRRQTDFMASRRQGQPGRLTNRDSRRVRVPQPARSRDTSSSERARGGPRTRFETTGGRRFVTTDRSARRGEFPDARFPGDRRPIPTRPIDTGFGRDRRFGARGERGPARFGPIPRTGAFFPPPRGPIGGAIGFDGLSPFRGTGGPRFPGAITFDGGPGRFAFGRGFPMLEGGAFPGASPILTSTLGSGPFDPFMGGTLTPSGFSGF